MKGYSIKLYVYNLVVLSIERKRRIEQRNRERKKEAELGSQVSKILILLHILFVFRTVLPFGKAINILVLPKYRY